MGVGATGGITSALWTGLAEVRWHDRYHSLIAIVSRARKLARILAFDGRAGTSNWCKASEGAPQRSGSSRARSRLSGPKRKEISKGAQRRQGRAARRMCWKYWGCV